MAITSRKVNFMNAAFKADYTPSSYGGLLAGILKSGVEIVLWM